MSFRKPFRAVPVEPSAHYRRKQQITARKSALSILGIAGVTGAILGVASVELTGDGRTRISGVLKPVGVAVGIMRAREPQVGDSWSGCNDARSVGTAPIYIGEPGYREDMDGDGDGIACEPHRRW
ncbi:MAG: excalibur calcium-binding domain-containing protein [Sphingobium sp.]